MERLSKKILDNICFSEQIFQRKQSSGAPVKTLIKLSKNLDNICFSEQIFQRKQSLGAPVKTLIKLLKFLLFFLCELLLSFF